MRPELSAKQTFQGNFRPWLFFFFKFRLESCSFFPPFGVPGRLWRCRDEHPFN